MRRHLHHRLDNNQTAGQNAADDHRGSHYGPDLSVVGYERVLTDLCEAPLSLLQSTQVMLQFPHPQQLHRSGRMRIAVV